MELSAGETVMNLLMKSKKGAGFLEVNYVFTALLFFFIFGLMMNQVIPESESTERSFSEFIDDLVDELGLVTGYVAGTIFGIGNLIFSVFGVSLINSFDVLPVWFNSFLSLYSTFVVVFLTGWTVSWVRGLIPTT